MISVYNFFKYIDRFFKKHTAYIGSLVFFSFLGSFIVSGLGTSLGLELPMGLVRGLMITMLSIGAGLSLSFRQYLVLFARYIKDEFVKVLNYFRTLVQSDDAQVVSNEILLLEFYKETAYNFCPEWGLIWWNKYFTFLKNSIHWILVYNVLAIVYLSFTLISPIFLPGVWLMFLPLIGMYGIGFLFLLSYASVWAYIYFWKFPLDSIRYYQQPVFRLNPKLDFIANGYIIEQWWIQLKDRLAKHFRLMFLSLDNLVRKYPFILIMPIFSGIGNINPSLEPGGPIEPMELEKEPEIIGLDQGESRDMDQKLIPIATELKQEITSPPESSGDQGKPNIFSWENYHLSDLTDKEQDLFAQSVENEDLGTKTHVLLKTPGLGFNVSYYVEGQLRIMRFENQFFQDPLHVKDLDQVKLWADSTKSGQLNLLREAEGLGPGDLPSVEETIGGPLPFVFDSDGSFLKPPGPVEITDTFSLTLNLSQKDSVSADPFEIPYADDFYEKPLRLQKDSLTVIVADTKINLLTRQDEQLNFLKEAKGLDRGLFQKFSKNPSNWVDLNKPATWKGDEFSYVKQRMFDEEEK